MLREPAHYVLGVRLVEPEIGLGRLFFQPGYLFFPGGDIKDAPLP
jgi:hypothetical protein